MNSGPKPIVPPTGNEIALNLVGDRFVKGIKLTHTDENMAMVAAAAAKAEQFGPTPANMTVKSQPLPESVKGVLAHYAT